MSDQFPHDLLEENHVEPGRFGVANRNDLVPKDDF